MSQGMWDLKKLMFAVQGSLCFYCWKPMTQEKEHIQAAHYATKDHLVPVSQGGAADWTNTILACLACNRVKSNRMPTEAERARHGHLYALFNERVELRRAELAAKEAKKAAAASLANDGVPIATVALPAQRANGVEPEASSAGLEAQASAPTPPPKGVEGRAEASLTPDA